MPKSTYFIMYQVTPDHAFGQALLIFLVDHPAAGSKVLLATLEEFTQGNLLFEAAA